MPRLPALLALLLAAPPVLAGGGPGLKAELAQRLQAAGRAGADALALLTAARLRRAAGLPGWEAWAAEAAALAGPDSAVAALAADLLGAGDRGLLSGPRTTSATLPPGETHAYPGLAFEPGALAEVYVEGEGTSGLDLVVEGPAGAVCRDEGAGDVAYCAWRPAGAGAVTVRITNTGPAPNRYLLMTN